MDIHARAVALSRSSGAKTGGNVIFHFLLARRLLLLLLARTYYTKKREAVNFGRNVRSGPEGLLPIAIGVCARKYVCNYDEEDCYDCNYCVR